MLQTYEHGGPGSAPTLLIAHGLFGSGRNWGVIAKRLSDRGQVVTVDMRNHGASPWADTHGYQDLAADLAQVIEQVGGPVDLLGHSMGGKSAMVLAHTRPELLRRVVVADIAPVTYDHTQQHAIDAMRAVDLSALQNRSDAAKMMTGIDEELKPFLLQSLDMKEKRWRLNLDVLQREMNRIIGFPEISGSFEGPTLFLTGADSDYVRPDHRPTIKSLFPSARFARIPGAGHWLHAQKPREFEAAIRGYLDA